jgi:intracellular protein transport protein USO1
LLRYSACVLLISILQNRPQRVQAYFLTAPAGPTTVIALLEGNKEIVEHGEHSFRPSLGSFPSTRH